MNKQKLNEFRDLGDRSYWAMWLKEYPQYKPNSLDIKAYLAELFEKRMRRIDNLKDKIENYVQAYNSTPNLAGYERVKTAILASFGPEITDRNFFWEPIPARTYKAIISRNRARSQGQISTEISPRVLKDCLDSICRAAAIITTNSSGFSPDDPQARYQMGIFSSLFGMRTIKMLKKAGGDDKCIYGLYSAVSSFCTFENGKAINDAYMKFKQKYGEKGMSARWNEYQDMIFDLISRTGAGDWLTNDSDSQVGEDIEQEMKNQPYDIYEKPELAVSLINKLVDRVHIRGDLAGAFVEGGAPTCSAASNMKPDELYESKADQQIHYWAHMLDEAFNRG